MRRNKRQVMLIAAETPGYPLRADKAPGRNDPCPCKSGKKVKNCCGIDKQYYQRIPKPVEPERAPAELKAED